MPKKQRKNFSESDIQRLLYFYTAKQNKKLWVHNIYLFNWESDFIAVDDKGKIFEYEIKLSLTDFKADFRKRKHSVFGRALAEKTTPYAPNYFYFVCPAGVVSPNQVPSYAGLIYVYPNNELKAVKKPKQLHSVKRGQTSKVLSNIAKSLSHRWYSKSRINK